MIFDGLWQRAEGRDRIGRIGVYEYTYTHLHWCPRDEGTHRAVSHLGRALRRTAECDARPSTVCIGVSLPSAQNAEHNSMTDVPVGVNAPGGGIVNTEQTQKRKGIRDAVAQKAQKQNRPDAFLGA